MSSFTDPLDVRFHSLLEWEILSSFSYYKEDDHNDIITVPKGFITDFATIPRLFWTIFPPHDIYVKAAVIHDYLYANAIGTKKEADLLFKEMLKVCGVPSWKIQLMYQAVRLFGKGSFTK